MKKIVLILICLLCSNLCFALCYKGVIKNRRCLVIQALDKGALGYICPMWAITSSDCRSGQFVYFNFNNDFVDNQMFNIPKNYYLQPNGIYRYTNRDDVIKTVRSVDLILK